QLLVTSDRNGRTIEESAELYIRLSNSMGELGYSTQSTISYIDTLSNLMTINKTNSLSAESATNALTKAQMKGKLAGVEAMTVFNAMPSILKTLGKQLNKTEAEVRKMASDGKLSMSEFTEAMIAAQEETAALADNMRNTVTDGINRVTNNLKKYFGELNNSTGATKLLVDSLILMSQHVDILMTGVGALAAVYAGKYITSLANATKQSAEKVIENIKLATSERNLAKEELRSLEIEGKKLTARRNELVALKAVTTSKIQLAAIEKQLNNIDKQRTVLIDKEALAQTRLASATKLSTLAANGLKGAMSLLGGPAGMLFLAAGALTMWSSKIDEAKQKSLELGDKVDQLREKYKSLNHEQKKLELSRLKVDIDKTKESIDEQTIAVEFLKKEYEQYKRRAKGSLSSIFTSQEGLNEAQNKYLEASDKLKKSQENLAKAEKARSDIESGTIEKTNEATEANKNLSKS
ncbi:tape measure protein, partial [Gilliamella sp. B2776]